MHNTGWVLSTGRIRNETLHAWPAHRNTVLVFILRVFILGTIEKYGYLFGYGAGNINTCVLNINTCALLHFIMLHSFQGMVHRVQVHLTSSKPQNNPHLL